MVSNTSEGGGGGGGGGGGSELQNLPPLEKIDSTDEDRKEDQETDATKEKLDEVEDGGIKGDGEAVADSDSKMDSPAAETSETPETELGELLSLDQARSNNSLIHIIWTHERFLKIS